MTRKDFIVIANALTRAAETMPATDDLMVQLLGRDYAVGFVASIMSDELARAYPNFSRERFETYLRERGMI